LFRSRSDKRPEGNQAGLQERQPGHHVGTCT
jgi:hypothetical protein